MRVDFVFVCAKPKRKQMELDDGTKKPKHRPGNNRKTAHHKSIK